jgi:hypothetical protein
MGRTDHPSTHLSTLSPPLPAPIVADVVLFDLFHKKDNNSHGQRERETVNSRERKKRENKIANTRFVAVVVVLLCCCGWIKASPGRFLDCSHRKGRKEKREKKNNRKVRTATATR